MANYNPPVSIQVYLGSGKEGLKLKENLLKKKGGKSLSELVVDLMRKADPTLFKVVVENGKK